MSLLPPGFPLAPLDRSGALVKEGDKVKILEIPGWLVHDLPEQEAAAVKSCIGSEMVVYEIDEYGYFWVRVVTFESESEYAEQTFAMEPKNVVKVHVAAS